MTTETATGSISQGSWYLRAPSEEDQGKLHFAIKIRLKITVNSIPGAQQQRHSLDQFVSAPTYTSPWTPRSSSCWSTPRARRPSGCGWGKMRACTRCSPGRRWSSPQGLSTLPSSSCCQVREASSFAQLPLYCTIRYLAHCIMTLIWRNMPPKSRWSVWLKWRMPFVPSQFAQQRKSWVE